MTMLWLLRHAKAVPHESGEDRDRALAPKGEAAMREMARWAAARRLAPALVLCSSALRARQTLALLAPVLEHRPALRFEDGLYLAGADSILARLRRIAARCESTLVVGHNPGLHELAMLLLRSGSDGPAKRLAQGMPTGALAGFAWQGAWPALAPGAAELMDYVTPKDLGE